MPACSRTARRSGCRTTIRCRRRWISPRTSAISGSTWPCRCAGPASSESARGPAQTISCGSEIREFQVANAATTAGDPATLEVGALRTRLLLEREATEAYACLPLAHVVECRADQQVVLDDQFIPTILQIRAANRLATLATELLGLFHQRGEALGGRVAATSRGAASELADFLMLQAINRYEPVLAHFAESGVDPPGGVLPVLRRRGRGARDVHDDVEADAEIPEYRHDHLKETFEPVIVSLRESMSKVMTQNGDSDSARAAEVRHQRRDRAGSLAVQLGGLHPGGAGRRSGGERAAAVPDAGQDRARRRESAISCVRGLPGVPVVPVPVAPRQIPYHAGYAYFELDQTHELWEQLKNSGGVAIYVAGEFPGPDDGILGDSRLRAGPPSWRTATIPSCRRT